MLIVAFGKSTFSKKIYINDERFPSVKGQKNVNDVANPGNQSRLTINENV